MLDECIAPSKKLIMAKKTVKIAKKVRNVRKPTKKSTVNVYFKNLLREVIKVMKKRIEVSKMDLFKELEKVYNNGKFYKEGRKLY